MANTTYYLLETDSDLTGGDDFSKDLATGPLGVEFEPGLAIPISSGRISFAFTKHGVPNNPAWGTGDWSVLLVIPVVGVGDEIHTSVQLHRIDNDGNVLESSPLAPEQNITTDGVYTFNFLGLSWAPGDAGDRLRVDFSFRNDNAVDEASFRIRMNDGSSTKVSTPWAEGVVPDAVGMSLSVPSVTIQIGDPPDTNQVTMTKRMQIIQRKVFQ